MDKVLLNLRPNVKSASPSAEGPREVDVADPHFQPLVERISLPIHCWSRGARRSDRRGRAIEAERAEPGVLRRSSCH
jgi:hypothetical protein